MDNISAWPWTSSVQITVREGDIDQNGGDGNRTERAELDSGARALLGREAWCRFAFLLPQGFPIVDNRLVIAQWKQKGVDGPLVAERFRNGRHYITIRSAEGESTEHELPPLDLETWYRMVYHIRFSSRAGGLVEVWMNGTRVVSWEGGTAFPEGRNAFYHKIGLYRDRWPDPMTIFFDDYALGDAPAAIGLPPFDAAGFSPRHPELSSWNPPLRRAGPDDRRIAALPLTIYKKEIMIDGVGRGRTGREKGIAQRRHGN